MKLNYLPVRMKPTIIMSNMAFITPDGLRTLTPRKKIGNGYNVEESIYDINLYVANSMIQYTNVQKRSIGMFDQESIVAVVVKNQMDFYPFWLSAIDKLIRYFGYNVTEAIQFQLDMNRVELYDMINKKELLLFPKYTERAKKNP